MTQVLLIEDDHWLAEGMVSRLRTAGYEVTHVAHGYAAIEAIDAVRPDVMVLDVLLAGATAFSLLHELQSYADTASIPVILCTNLAEQFDAKKLEDYGVRRVLDKTTMEPDDVVVAVKAVLA